MESRGYGDSSLHSSDDAILRRGAELYSSRIVCASPCRPLLLGEGVSRLADEDPDRYTAHAELLDESTAQVLHVAAR